jgi:uncharacterized oxidoreductase
MRKSGNTVLITGGAAGLGLELAKIFIENKNEVIICDINGDELEVVKREYTELHTYICDVGRKDDLEKFFQEVLASFPNLNILINNAAICEQHDLTKEIPRDAFAREMAINFLGPSELIRMFLPIFLNNSGCAIINICSGCGVVPYEPVAFYSGTKAGITFFSRALRGQLKHKLKKLPGLVMEVYPPTMDTPMNQKWNIKKVKTRVVAERILDALQKNKKQLWMTKLEIRIYYSLGQFILPFIHGEKTVLVR